MAEKLKKGALAADADARAPGVDPAVNRERIEAWIKVRGAWPGALLAPVTKGGRVLQRAMTAQAVLMRLRTIAARADVRRVTPEELRHTSGGTVVAWSDGLMRNEGGQAKCQPKRQAKRQAKTTQISVNGAPPATPLTRSSQPPTLASHFLLAVRPRRSQRPSRWRPATRPSGKRPRTSPPGSAMKTGRPGPNRQTFPTR